MQNVTLKIKREVQRHHPPHRKLISHRRNLLLVLHNRRANLSWHGATYIAHTYYARDHTKNHEMLNNNKSYLNLLHKVNMDYNRPFQNPLQVLTVHILKQPSSYTNQYRLQNHDPNHHNGSTTQDNGPSRTAHVNDNEHQNLYHKPGHRVTDNHWTEYRRTPSAA